MRSSNFMKGALLIIFLAMLPLAMIIPMRGENYHIAQNVEQEINSTIKKGDDYKKVTEFLDSKKLYDRGYLEVKNGVIEDSRLSGDKFLSMGSAGALIVLIPNVKISFFSRDGLLLVFYFDSQKDFMGYTVKSTGISL